MRVLFINPWAGEVFPPPSLGYLQAVVKAAGHEVTSMDMNDEHYSTAKHVPWDLVAISFHSFSVRHAINIRQHFDNHRLICGGHHPSAMPEQMLGIGYDQVVIGEGEKAIIDIINGNTNKVVYGLPCNNLDEIPFPDYSGFSGTWSMGMPVISSRGCPFDCNFCASADFWGRRWKMRSTSNVIAEILHSRHKQFMFEDDNFTLNRRRAIEICDALREIGGFSWQCASRAETLNDDELCWNLRSAGCHTVWLGVESLSQASLDRCGKRTTVEKMLSGIKVAHTHKLNTFSQFIVGLPGDTQEDIDITCRNIRKSSIGRRGANILWILPRTEAYRRAKQQGFDDDTYLRSGAPFYTYEQSIETLKQWEHQINNA